MSGLAQFLKTRGHKVQGSDRARDAGNAYHIFHALESSGIVLYRQDGSGFRGKRPDGVLYSRAIEEDNPDLLAAKALGVHQLSRAEFLSQIFNAFSYRVAIAGTSGKSTVCAMTGLILQEAGLEPTLFCGASVKNFQKSNCLGNFLPGSGHYIVAEADESDEAISLLRPHVGVITNISKDHKSLEELIDLFIKFGDEAQDYLVLNHSEALLRKVFYQSSKLLTFGLEGGAQVKPGRWVLQPTGSVFELDGLEFSLKVPGLHNLLNALCSVAIARALHIDLRLAQRALSLFEGLKRRLEPLGSPGGVKVFDDYAHNPQKISASLHALKGMSPHRLWVIFQPHGYGPFRFLKGELFQAFSQGLGADDRLLLLEIHYAGGTAKRDISSQELAIRLQEKGKKALFLPDRGELLALLGKEAQEGDIVVIMGARDESLTQLAQRVIKAIESTSPPQTPFSGNRRQEIG